MRRSVLLLVALVVGATQITAETKVGTVVSSSGTVSIDAFGTGAFVAVIPGDVLYTSSVLRTGSDGRAVVDLEGTRREIPPGARVGIADLVSTGEKRGGLSWFSVVGRILKSFAAATGRQESDRVLGSRSGDRGQRGELEWELEETDAEWVLPQALEDVAAGSYGAALEKLAAAETPSDPGLCWYLLFWKGFCYYQMEDYGDAAACLLAAHGLDAGSKTPLSTPSDRGTLLFQLSSSYFLLGQEKASVSILDAYLAENPEGQHAPYATVLLARALAATGDAARARSVAEDGAVRYKGSDLETEFSLLAR